MLRILAFKALIIIVLLQSACLEKEEGCLDPYAVNFRASATEECCCEYPRARVQWYKTYLGELAGDSTVFSDLNGWQYYLLNLDIVFSENQLINTSGEIFGIREKIDVLLLDNSSISALKNDISRLTWHGEFTTLGTMRFTGSAEKLNLGIGLSSIWNKVNPSGLPASHVLNRPPEMYISPETGYAIVRLEIGLEPGAESGLQIIADNPSEIEWIEIPLSFDIPRNTNFDIPLEIQLDVLFEGISFLEMTNLQISELLVNNLKSAVIQHTP